MKYRSIQALRAVAAVSVLLFHLNSNAFHFGWAGVDLFFVISGFIMGTIGRRQRPIEFAKSRIFRVVPLYWLVTLLMCSLAMTTHLMSNFSFTPSEVVQSLLFIPYYDATRHVWPLVIPGWTLNYEMFFYGVFTIALFTPRPVLITACVLFVLVVAGALMSPASAPFSVWTNPLLLEFAGGLGLSALTGSAKRGVGCVALAAGAVGFIASALMYGGDNELFRASTFGASALLAAFGALSIERSGTWPEWLRPIEHIGDISYSVYLLHGVILSAGAKVLGSSPPAIAVTLAIVFVLAEISHRVVEVRASKLLRAPRYWASLSQALSTLRG